MNNIAGLLLICVGETVYGMAWEINRRLPEREGKWPNFETLMVSKDVFEFEDDAKRDAVRTLESFGCNRADDSGWSGAGTFSSPGGPGRRPDQALRDRPVGLVRSLLQIRQTLGPGDVDVEVLDVDVDLVRRRGQRLSSPDCPG